jgi:cysteine-rich repeat protein
MKPWNTVVSVLFIGSVVIASPACGILDGDAEATDEMICTPDANVFCKCADLTKGTKRCRDDGKSFEACRTEATGECIGGEIEDPDTGKNPDLIDGVEPGSALDKCPGKSTTAQPNVAFTLEGETTLATVDRAGREGACAVGTGAKDHVYDIIPSGSGSLEIKVAGKGGFSPIAYLRTTCDDQQSQIACAPPASNATATFRTAVVTGKHYFLIVDGTSGSTGGYTVTGKLTTGSFCGDGKVDKDEACDDGNKISDTDGCSNDCKRITGNPPSGGSCPGHPVDIWPTRFVTGTGSTTVYGNSWSTPDQTCNKAGSNDYQDHIYAVTPHATGILLVTLTAPPAGTLANLMLSARKKCDDPSSQTDGMCTNTGGTSAGETLRVPVTSGDTIYIAVDGGASTNNKSDYSIRFEIQ